MVTIVELVTQFQDPGGDTLALMLHIYAFVYCEAIVNDVTDSAPSHGNGDNTMNTFSLALLRVGFYSENRRLPHMCLFCSLSSTSAPRWTMGECDAYEMSNVHDDDALIHQSTALLAMLDRIDAVILFSVLLIVMHGSNHCVAVHWVPYTALVVNLTSSVIIQR